jgi:hypothetical protein
MSSWLEKFKGWLSRETFVGVLPDDRKPEEQARDWQAEELASSASMVPTFRKVGKNKWKKYTIRDQNGSGSCVAQAIAKGFEVLYKKETGKTVVFSATPIYQKRQNRPSAGMYIHNAFTIAVQNGTCPEENCPSQFMTDVQMDATPLPLNYEELNDFLDAVAYVSMPKDFDYVAAWVEKHGYINLHIAADRRSWSKDFPSLGSRNRGISHAVAAVDAVTYNNKQYIVIEDSWGEFGEFTGQRLLSREVFNDMFTRGAGFTVLQYDVKPKAKFDTFNVWMEFGQRNDEVRRLQDFLKAKGFFPSNVESTGFYGNITALAVYNYQIARQVASPVILNKYKGKYCHAATLQAINNELG